jgi:hypothetical protein
MPDAVAPNAGMGAALGHGSDPAGPRLARGAGVAGLVFAALFVAAFGLLRVDSPPSDPLAFAAWWAASQDRISFGTFLVPIAGMSFIWFVAAVRRRIGSGEGLFFSTLFLGSGLVYVAMLCATGAAAASISAATLLGPLSTQLVATMGHSLAYAFFFGFAVRMSAMFMLAVASIGRGGQSLPRWLTLLTIALGAVSLVGGPMFEGTAVIFPAWVTIVSLLLIRTSPA